MTNETKREITALIQRESELQKAALTYRCEASAIDAAMHPIAEKYRLAAQHFADGAKLCADRITDLIKNSNE